jgi:2-keto-3-deoxy-L-rhamnonate aldolase RhmA
MLKDKLANNDIVIGTWLQIPSPSICEIAAHQKLDWIAVDMEHTEIGYETIANMFRGLNGTQTAPMVRVRSNDSLDIRRALDIGAEGIIVPLIETPEEAKKAVEYCKYPPYGERGYAFCRANNWGGKFSDYSENANDNISVFVMIESKKAVQSIDEILNVEGLDGVFIGPYDMSASYGVVGQVNSDLVIQGCQKVLEACKKHNKIAGLHIVSPDEDIIRENIRKGFRLIAIGIDTVFIINGIKKAFETAKIAISDRKTSND